MKRSQIKRSRSQIRKVRARYDRAFWPGQRKLLKERANVVCEWMTPTEGRCQSPGTDGAHVKPLGMGRSRNDKNLPENQLVNLLWLCRKHHDRQEYERIHGPAWQPRVGATIFDKDPRFEGNEWARP